MKTKNNVQKAITKTFAAGISLVLISITVNAQDLWKSVIENSGLNTIATAMVEPVSGTANTENYNATNADLTAFNVETEAPLELESWMTDESIFHSSLNIETETEAPLALEDWMTNENVFNVNNFTLEEEAEEALSLENWMTDDNYFEVKTVKIIEETEEPLELEEWMTSEKIW